MKVPVISLALISINLVVNAGLYDALSSSDKTVTTKQIQHKCPKPIKQTNFESQREVNTYNDKIHAYQICINKFIKEHTQPGKEHTDAVNRAISEWNKFISGHNEKEKPLGIKIKKGLSSPGQSHTIGHEDPTKITKDISF